MREMKVGLNYGAFRADSCFPAIDRRVEMPWYDTPVDARWLSKAGSRLSLENAARPPLSGSTALVLCFRDTYAIVFVLLLSEAGDRNSDAQTRDQTCLPTTYLICPSISSRHAAQPEGLRWDLLEWLFVRARDSNIIVAYYALVL